ncbi:juvenile hormone esterase-like isoform X2 [Macrosteles quadrilineatus]|uniref:juvenile hormone esterase-like isoform X2 n=1 Tax=Macrosteles quadrilineatus TaxID=74068 RepID=UPI0023E2B4B5|nr:juvenile hormone esterase-like isoform X2 [Macrosteles quadrilineatus]
MISCLVDLKFKVQSAGIIIPVVCWLSAVSVKMRRCCVQVAVVFVLCLMTLSLGSSLPPDPAVVRTALGNLRGNSLVTYTGTSFFAFRGVRYAEEPTGDYRFKPPVPVKPWGSQVRDAMEDGPVCPQPYASQIGPKWSEDCLFLNIYSKKLSNNAKQPVMVFLHPGGYAAVTGSSYWDGPQYLLEKDIVLVTINYRLGALGFLSTQDTILPGNYGMKDQVEAFKWVQQNILAFGGDPDNVTIFGYSAGGASVTLHMVSPLSRGLFHRAIAMSGSFTSGWALNRDPKSLASRLARHLGCSSSDSRLIYACLMSHSAEQIVNATSLIKDFAFEPIALFAPVIEVATDSNPFLQEDPLILIRDGRFAQVPFVTGITRDEFAARGYYVLQNKSLTEEFNNKFEKFAPIEFMYEREGERSSNISAEIKRFYLGDQKISNKSKTQFMQIYTDSLITFSVVQTARLFAAKSSSSVYLYLFDYQGKYSHNYVPGTKTPLESQVTHASQPRGSH